VYSTFKTTEDASLLILSLGAIAVQQRLHPTTAAPPSWRVESALRYSATSMKTPAASIEELNDVLAATPFLKPYGFMVKTCNPGECTIVVPFVASAILHRWWHCCLAERCGHSPRDPV
jgi:hypothetical protein